MKKDKSAAQPTECPDCGNKTLCQQCRMCHYCYDGSES